MDAPLFCFTSRGISAILFSHMRRITAIVLVLLVVASAVPIFGQTESRLKSCPAAFRTFYKKFGGAVQRGDKTAVAAMTKFPFRWGFDAGDEGKYTQRQFVRNFRKLFDSDTLEFIRERNPLCDVDTDRTVYLTSDFAVHLGFKRSGKTYKFSSYVVEP